MDVTPLVWWLTIGITTAVLLVDVVVIGRRPHEPSRKEVSIALAVFVAIAAANALRRAARRRANHPPREVEPPDVVLQA